ncbi:Zn-dependent alcohol dehydrogenase [Flavivirga algicola]|uniref:Zn-dependent alcohol dehydrogenase n=1 Tax=Flavivirga algicola TaxID=2729136 RepID=A0ABX1S009_9FLAO|nr:Zn-dependent alcohol dehydrogenase [Flavivirga algicola]NMH87925.1 Zn-dependent alcohol dehydrogenase [Flavivirga algicola]
MSLLCKAAISHGDGTFSIETIEVQNPKNDEVLVAVKAAGLCHTDHDSLNWGKPIIMGHEGAGIVKAVGSSVKSVKVGDAVILNWATPCGTCFQCENENEHICENNSPVVAGANGYTAGHAHIEGATLNGTPIERSFNIGTLSEYTLVKESAVVKNPIQDMSFSAASIVSCGVMTGFGSAVNTAQVAANTSAVVLGTGGVGLNVIQGIKVSKASKIIAIDINQTRLDMAVEFGATHTILADKDDKGLLKAAEKVKEMTDGRGADYAFECTAIPELGAAPLAMVRNAGTAVQVSGIEQEVLINMELFEWDKKYINPLYGKCNPQKDFPKIIEHYKNGEIKLDEMITRTYSLDDLQQAFDDMLTGKNAKGVIVFE